MRATNKRRTAFIVIAVMATGLGITCFAQVLREGYKDTPVLPEQKWMVHDSDRPYPRAVTPGAVVGAPPSDAIVLFDGKDLSQWVQMDNKRLTGKPIDPKWPVKDGYFEVGAGTGSLFSKDKFGDCQLHIEWQEDEKLFGTGQNRGNSGIYLMGLYEVQILDSYRAATYADGQAGSLYGQWPPMVNPIRKSGEWQAYDIVFEAPKWNGDKLVSPAYMTVFFNGVVVHNRQKLNGPSAHRAVQPYKSTATEERLIIQDHNPNFPIRFRNIWIRKLNGYDQPEK
jgi:hypothetical protein